MKLTFSFASIAGALLLVFSLTAALAPSDLIRAWDGGGKLSNEFGTGSFYW